MDEIDATRELAELCATVDSRFVRTLLAALDAEKARVKELEERNAELASEVNQCRRAINRSVTDCTQLRASIAAMLERWKSRSEDVMWTDVGIAQGIAQCSQDLRALLEKP